MKIKIPVSEIEIDTETGNIYVHGPQGNTPLRIQFARVGAIAVHGPGRELSWIDLRIIEYDLCCILLGEDAKTDA